MTTTEYVELMEAIGDAIDKASDGGISHEEIRMAIANHIEWAAVHKAMLD